MHTSSEAKLLRVFLNETDKHQGRPMYEEIVMKARERGMAGATVLRGLLGFGRHSRIHSSKILRLSEDLPVIVEIVDTPDQIEKFITDLDKIMQEGLVTIETITARTYNQDTSAE